MMGMLRNDWIVPSHTSRHFAENPVNTPKTVPNPAPIKKPNKTRTAEIDRCLNIAPLRASSINVLNTAEGGGKL